MDGYNGHTIVRSIDLRGSLEPVKTIILFLKVVELRRLSTLGMLRYNLLRDAMAEFVA